MAHESVIVSARRDAVQTSPVAVQTTMTAVDDLWFLADGASQQAEQTYHRLSQECNDYLEFETEKHVSRRRFRTVASRIEDNGAPYGAHTIAYREGGELLLVRHAGVNLWVLPGGETDGDEGFREAARRELREEAGVETTIGGLGMLGRVTFYTEGHTTWGVLPLFEAELPAATDPTVEDPDDEISAAEWFADLPSDTRDKKHLERWRRQRL